MQKITKWFDHRIQSPVACELIFIKEWLTARDKYMSRNKLDIRFDENGKSFKMPFRHITLDALKNDTQLWDNLIRLQEIADRNNIPYRIFWSIAFEVVSDLSFSDDEVKKICSPLYISSIIERFMEISRSRIILSSEPCFQAEAYVGSLPQREYVEYVINEVKRRYPATYDEKIKILVAEKKLPSFNQAIDGLKPNGEHRATVTARSRARA
jgi:hypothetical protein